VVACLGLVSLAAPLAHAANGTWLSTGSNQTWSDTTNWVSGIVPGATTGVGNTDVATFNTAVGSVGTSGNPLTIDSGRNLRTISFDTSAGNYTIGTTGGNALNLTTASVIQISANATGSGIVQTINAPLLLNGGLTINNAAANGVARFEIGGGISSATAGLKTLTLNSASANLLMNNVSGLIGDGAGQVTVIQGGGGGLWTLSNDANSFTGNLVVRDIMAVTSIGNSGVASAAGAGTTINLGTGGSTGSLRYTGNSTTTNRTFNLNASTGASGIIVENAATVLTITSNITNTVAATTLTKALALSGNGSGVISGNILNSTGNGTGVTKTGSGTWTLSGNNTYSGPTIVNTVGGAGTLVGIGANAFGTSSQYQIIGNVTLSLRNDTSTTYAASLQFSSTGGGTINVDQATSAGSGAKTFTLGAVTSTVAQNTFAINFTGGNNTSLSLGAYTGQVGTAISSATHTLNNNISGGGNLTIASYTGAVAGVSNNDTLIFAGSGDTTITGAITQGTRPLALTMNGTGTATLAGANTYAGATSITGGTLKIATATGLGFGGVQTTVTGATTVSSGFTLDLNGATGINEPITLSGTGIGGNGALINTGAAASINNGIAGLTIGNATMGTGSGYSSAPTVTIVGTGSGATATATLGLTASSFTSVTAGTSTLWNNGDIVSLTGVGVGTGATATVIASGANGTITGLTITNAGQNFSGSTTGLTIARLSSSNPGATVGTAAVGGFNAGNFTVSGVAVTAAGSGYTGTPTYTFGSGNAVAGSATLSSVVLAANTSIGGTDNITIDAVVRETGGVRSLTKVGGNTLTLNGSNTYTGGTTVTVGTLLVNNAAGTGTGTGAVTVASGATLGGTGAIAMTGANGVSVSGILAPGNTSSIGNFTISLGNTTGNVTMLTGATFAFNITGGTPDLSDRIVLLGTPVDGDFVFNNNVINFTPSGSLTNGQSYLLFDGSTNGQFTGLTFSGNQITGGLSFAGLAGGFQTDSTLTLVGGDIIFTAIPEPSTWMLIALGLTFVVVMRRRPTARG